MRKLLLSLLPALLLAAGIPARAAAEPVDLRTQMWPARWISVPGADPHGYGVYYFRKDIELQSVPSVYTVHVTGDNRYKLYVNGILASLGPAKGDATHWNYETVDIAPLLSPGKNAIAAVVYHEGALKPDSQISVSTGFLLQGEGEAGSLRTDGSWKCIQDKSYGPIKPEVVGYYVAGPGERIDMSLAVKDWKTGSCAGWADAVPGRAGEPVGVIAEGQSDGHNLQPSIIPQMELREQRLVSVRKSEGVNAGDAFLSGNSPVNVPVRTDAELLLDLKELTNAYFHLRFSGGKGGEISVGYAESLYYPDNVKGNRDDIEGKIFIGREDRILPDGTLGQSFTTLSWRTYRYVRIKVRTGDEPLVLEDAYGTFTGYPFKLEASIETADKEIQDIFSIGWRTARLCAAETYMDCPYYEQLQYLGDTRIQALVTLYNTSDDRLVKSFLRLADISRTPEGITRSRYPTTGAQYIQPYALCYIFALHDYMMYGADTRLVFDLLPGVEQILGYFARYQQEDGRLKDLPGWNFSDWVYVPTWERGVPQKGADGCSILVDLQLLRALQLASEMEEVRGNSYHSGIYASEADKLAKAIKENYWCEERGLFSDRIEHDNYSQHANALAILCGIADDPSSLVDKLLKDNTLAPCSIYFRYYLHQALVKAGLGDGYLDWLDIWRENIALGMTTWGEKPGVSTTRSDCHAWGSSPNIELFRTVLGIDSDAVAFGKVKIEPHLGDIGEIGGTMPHPAGSVSVHYKRLPNGIEAEIELPSAVEGTFLWKGMTLPVHGGKNKLKMTWSQE